MPLILPKSVMLMVPRTASTWCRQAVRNAGLRCREHGPKHSTSLPANAPAFKFTILREPEAWVRSRWALGPWEDALTAEWDVNYATFRERVTDSMVRMYFNAFAQGCQFVGSGDNVADDLVAALRLAGESFDETSLRATPRINESPTSGDPIPEWFWTLKRDELGELPPDMIGRLPLGLIQQLPPKTWETLPPSILSTIAQRATLSALQSAGAATRA